MDKKIKKLWILIFILSSIVSKGGIFSEYSDLKTFGEKFFENFIPPIKQYQLPLSEDYIVGPGDTIVINVWGFFEQEYQKEIDTDGSIFVSGIGKIYLTGKKLKEVKKIIEDKFYKRYKNIQVSVSIEKVRTINVFVLGEVKKPGVYEISPFFYILDVLSIAGGPNKIGSLRKIEIIKNDGEKEMLDIYPLLLKGEKPKVFQFQNGDIIFVHQSENLVGIIGEVKRPAIYELKEMKLKEIIDLSGGFLPSADISHIQIERIDKEKGKILIDVDEKDIDNFKLKNYDIVKIPSINLKSFYQVEVLGAVKNQRVYGWKEGLKIKDILKEEDLLPFAEKGKAEIVRIQNGFREILTFSPEKLFKEDTNENLILMPQDKIIIYSKERPEKKVFIYGEVKFPGEYIIETGEKLSSVIKRAGSFTNLSYPKGTMFFRETIKKQKEKEIERYVKEKREILKTYLKTTLDIEEKQLIEKGIMTLEKLLEIEPTGRIVIKMEEFENSLYDIILENNDIIYIPKKPVYISIIGEVNNPTNIFYQENLTLNDYIDKVGGFTKDADRKNIYIIRVDGSSDKNLEKIEPGDTIIVPFEPKGEKMRLVKDIMQIFYQMAVGVGVLIK
ncbi:MAG: SLBB domain-containing protein [Candidatus Omnitrophica bacterium]|nr:SLBB domain-containing protein [Candidatus Omnitrophota bacterium]